MEISRKRRQRFSVREITVFSTGNILGDLILAVFSSYSLTFQTKVLGLPSNIVGLLWLVPSIIDAFLALLIGHVSDNVRIPYMSRFYGKRKTWHLIGCTLAALSFPFLLMSCFVCGGDVGDWKVVLYYVPIAVVCYSGMGLTQSNFLALIPEVATRQSEMVKLGAVSSAMALLSGVYVYAVMWVLLGADVNATLSQKQSPEFMKLVLISLATGLFFEMLFHVGVREPSAEGICRKRRGDAESNKAAVDKKGKRSKSLPHANDTCHKEASLEENCKTNGTTKPATSHVNLSYENEEDKDKAAGKPGSSAGQSDADNAKALREMLQQTLPEENMTPKNQDSDSDSLSTISYEGFASEGWSSGHESTDDVDSDNFELFMPETFVDMVPFHSNVILSSRRASKVSGIAQFIANSRGPSRTASKKSRRSEVINRRASHDVNSTPPMDSRRASRVTALGLHSEHYHDSRRSSKATTHGLHSELYRRSSNMYQQSPLATIEDIPPERPYTGILSVSRQNSKKTWEGPAHTNQFSSRNVSMKRSPLADATTQDEVNHSPTFGKRWEDPIVNQFSSRNASIKKSPLAMETPAQDEDYEVKVPTKVRLSLTPEHITDHFVINTIEDELEYEEEEEPRTTWVSVFKNPRQIKLGCAYMFTRLAQNVTTAYMPLFLTDHLNYNKMAIAYFPIVMLVSGVVASFGGKKLNTILGNKWTFCLGSIMVMGASGWFYLLTPENRSVMYVPAVLSGCGTSIMFVTTLALAAEFVDADRKSGAFLMASMGFIAKIVTGVLFCLLQEFTPKQVSPVCPECISYVRHVFSLTPGVSALFGLVAFMVFIPATIQCKPIIETEDAETQTDESSFASSTASILDVIEEDIDVKEVEPEHGAYFNVIEEESEIMESEVMENEIMGNEVVGNEVVGNEIMGNEVVGNEKMGNEAIENTSTENEIVGNMKEEEKEPETYDTAM